MNENGRMENMNDTEKKFLKMAKLLIFEVGKNEK